jgi:hypothetical protein
MIETSVYENWNSDGLGKGRRRRRRKNRRCG